MNKNIHYLLQMKKKRFVVEIVSRVRLILSFSQSRGVRADNLDRDLNNSRDELTAKRTASDRRNSVKKFADRVPTLPENVRIVSVQSNGLTEQTTSFSNERPYKF